MIDKKNELFLYLLLKSTKPIVKQKKLLLSKMKYNATNWKEWIYERFNNKEKYIVEFHEEHCEYEISSANNNIKTKVFFSFMNNEDDEVLYDIQFSKGNKEDDYRWASPFTTDKEFKASLLDQIKAGAMLQTSLFYNDKFLTRLEEEWLSIPFQYGWTEETWFVGEKLYKAKLVHSGNFNRKIIEKVSYNLNMWDQLKLFFGIGKSSHVAKIEKIG
jgi:hypothetical protein